MFKLNNLRSPLGSNHTPKRKGKGIGSGWGKTAGKGHKGQHARSGGGKIGQVFEGGQMSLVRKSPKVGFRSPLKRLKIAVNINKLGIFAGQPVTADQLTPRSEHRRSRKYVTIYGVRAPSNLPSSVEAHRVSPGARKILESKGVAITILEYKNGHRSVRPEKLNKKKKA